MVGTCKASVRALALAAVGAAVTGGAAFGDARLVGGVPRAMDPLAVEGQASLVSGLGLRGPGASACSQAAANCQEAVAPATGGIAGRSADHVPIAAIVDDFKTADNFTPTANATLSSICFWGFYGTSTTADPDSPAAGSEAFHIRILGTTTGAGTAGRPDESNVIADLFVGANIGYGFTITPGATLTRGAALPAPVTNTFSWNVDLSGLAQPINLTAGTCYWLEIRGATDGIPETARFRWAMANVTNATSADNVFYQGFNSIPTYDYVDLVGNAGDMAMCLNFALGDNSGCMVPPAPANSTCDTAQMISAPFSATGLNTLRSQLTTTPFCGFNPVNGNTVWFRVVGDGTTYTASTCGSGTNFDTVLNVYCLSDNSTCGAGNANLLCVTNNDTGPASCGSGTGGDPSEASWATAAGTHYLIAVYGFETTTGFFDFSLTSDGMPTSQPACVSDRCPLDNSGIALGEVDACGASTNSACNGAGVGMFTLGTPFKGTSFNLGASRDFDFWELDTAMTPIPDTTGNGTAWLEIEYEVEFPGIFNFFTGTCGSGNGTFIGGEFANYLDGGGCGPDRVFVEVLAGDNFRLNLLTVDFGGVPCASGDNDYRITVRLATVGACCIEATACFTTIASDCDLQEGVFQGDNTTCSPTDPCTAPATGACCSGTTCSVIAQAACAGANTRFAGNGSVCNIPGNSTTPCCKADFNQNGSVTVQDIFDFLSAYFGGDPQADINGGGTSVQDIFDFLAAYFGGCP